MSTRADFYIGRGMRAVYAGSISHDAFVDQLQPYFAGVQTETQFRAALEKVFCDYGAIRPEYGWPWPWSTSATTDTAICLHDGQVWVTHWSKRWAPLARYGRPSRAKCRFPDMLRGPKTAEWRLRRRIASQGGSFQVRTDEDVLGALLVRTAYALTRYWMHAHVGAGGQVLAMPPSERTASLLRAALEYSIADPEGMRELISQRQARQPHAAWELLNWVLDHRDLGWAPEEQELAYNYELPVYFGLPTPAHVAPEELPKSMGFKCLDPAVYAQGMRHLENVWSVVPFIYGNAVAAELQHIAPERCFEDADMQRRPYLADGTMATNRLRAREHAAALFWGE